MRWLAKALLQKSLSALPQAERANYLLQRHVTRSLPGAEAGFRRRFERATRHVEAYAGARARSPPRRRGLLRVRRGLGSRRAALLLGARRRAAGPRRPPAERASRSRQHEHRTARAARLRARPARPGRTDRVGGGARAPLRDPLPRTLDARATGLPAGSVDFVTSTSTLEHIPEDDLVPLLAECRRLLRSGRSRELAHRPERPLLALRPLAFALQLPALLRPDMGPGELGASCTRTAFADRTTCPRSSGRASPLSPRGRGVRTSPCPRTSTPRFRDY